jgi:plastocyanin
MVLTLAIAGLAPPFMSPRNSLVPQAQAASVILALVGDLSAWNFSSTSGPNPTIAVNQGDAISILLTTVDVLHQFVVDVNKNGLFDCAPPAPADKCSAFFGLTTPTTYPFTIDFPPGNYTYYCSQHPLGMRGTFRVSLHDVAVSGMTVSRNFAYERASSNPITANVNAANLGSQSETFTVTAFAN